MFDNLKVGILGGGQLGAMLLRSAIDFGTTVAVLDPATVPCAKLTTSFFEGDCLNYDNVLAFGKNLDVITIEKEAVNTKALKELAANGVKVYPSPEIIETIQDKFQQKQALINQGIPIVPGILIEQKTDLRQHIDKLPGCLKLCRDGYDGKGVMMLRSEADIEEAFDAPSVLEQAVDIAHELAVLVARNEQGEIACYDPVRMMFNPEKMILDFQVCPAEAGAEMEEKAKALAIKTVEALDVVGIMAVEMFISKGGELFVNELAPRPHNSGHHTIEACVTSQFEQLMRIVLGLPLGSPEMKSPSVMMNLLEPTAAVREQYMHNLEQTMAVPEVHLHWYGKSGGQEGRKMGHLTIIADTVAEAVAKANDTRNTLNKKA